MDKKSRDYKYEGTGLDKAEKKWGQKQFESYCAIYPHLSKLSDLQLLEELVFLEVLQNRYKLNIKKVKDTLEETAKKDGKVAFDNVVAPQTRQGYDENLNKILALKGKLGMFEEQRKLDAYKDIESLRRKFALWRQNNQGSRKVTCPHCAKLFFLMYRTENYEAKKSSFFKDKVLCNVPLHKIYKEGKITKENYAEILGVSPDYIDWLDENHFSKIISAEV